MKYEINLKSLPDVQKKNILDYVEFGDIALTVFKCVIGIPIAFVLIYAISNNWNLTWKLYFSLMIVITIIVNIIHAFNERNDDYYRKQGYQKKSAIGSTDDLNQLITLNQNYCNNCSSLAKKIASELETAKTKYNKNLFG